MKDFLLTFEVDEKAEQLFIHGDPVGLERFAKTLLQLAQVAKSGDFPHEHLFSEEWGDQYLSSERQSKDTRLINHVKVYGWPTIEGAKPYQTT